MPVFDSAHIHLVPCTMRLTEILWMPFYKKMCEDEFYDADEEELSTVQMGLAAQEDGEYPNLKLLFLVDSDPKDDYKYEAGYRDDETIGDIRQSESLEDDVAWLEKQPWLEELTALAAHIQGVIAVYPDETGKEKYSAYWSRRDGFAWGYCDKQMGEPNCFDCELLEEGPFYKKNDRVPIPYRCKACRKLCGPDPKQEYCPKYHSQNKETL